MKLDLLRQLMVENADASGPQILSAASGLVYFQSKFFVIGDDETWMAAFREGDLAPGSTHQLFAHDLPREPKARKAAKPDLESLVFLPPETEWPHGALLALGSGSTERRKRGALASLGTDGTIQHVRVIDLSALYGSVSALVEETNIEGAVLSESSLLLFNRGNRTHPDTSVLSVDLYSLIDGGAVQARLLKTISFPAIDGVPLSVTDACFLGDGRIAVSLVAEDTGDAYNDGRLAGAAIALLDARFEVLQVESIDPPVKIEGIHAWLEGDALSMFAVSDADNPDVAAGLFAGSFPLRS